MIKICKNRIVIGCASLSLPEGFYIYKMSNNVRGILFSVEEKTFTLLNCQEMCSRKIP